MAWRELAADYDRIREHIARVVPGFDDYNERVRKPGGFYLPNKPRDGAFPTATGKARFTAHPLHELRVEPGQLVMMTIRTHDQFNTTVYGLDDRYRGVKNERRVVLMNAGDIRERGLAAGDAVDLVGHFRGEVRGSPGASWWSTTSPQAAARRTSPKRTCWCRSTAPPTAATRRPRSMWSSPCRGTYRTLNSAGNSGSERV